VKKLLIIKKKERDIWIDEGAFFKDKSHIFLKIIDI
jgi:hypothetical protein